MCLAGGASKDMSCRKDVFSVGASKNKLSHAGRICLAGGPSRMQEGCVLSQKTVIFFVQYN